MSQSNKPHPAKSIFNTQIPTTFKPFQEKNNPGNLKCRKNTTFLHNTPDLNDKKQQTTSHIHKKTNAFDHHFQIRNQQQQKLQHNGFKGFSQTDLTSDLKNKMPSGLFFATTQQHFAKYQQSVYYYAVAPPFLTKTHEWTSNFDRKSGRTQPAARQ